MTQTPEPWLRRPGRPVPPGQGRIGWSCAVALPFRPATGRRGVAAVASWFCLSAKAARQTAHFPPPIAQADNASHDARLQGKREPPICAACVFQLIIRRNRPDQVVRCAAPARSWPIMTLLPGAGRFRVPCRVSRGASGAICRRFAGWQVRGRACHLPPDSIDDGHPAREPPSRAESCPAVLVSVPGLDVKGDPVSEKTCRPLRCQVALPLLPCRATARRTRP